MLWFLSQRYQLVVNVVVFQRNAERINAFFESLAPGGRIRVIDLDPASVRAAFQIRACLERGEFVVILADRAAPGKTARTAEATFLGRTARFPLGPFLLAGTLGCPVLLALCVRVGTARYRTLLRPLGDARRVPRREQEKQARELLAAYVAQLEAQCLRHPLQWFNFYEFWERDAGGAP
jgi:predicted LPLAT superfamily acyltransferase